MEQKEIKINCPEGFEIDKENSTFECIKFKPIKKKLPETWEEFCEMYPKVEEEYYISSASRIINYSENIRIEEDEKNLLPSKELAEAMLALCQLIQLRDCYNGGWKPDWKNFNEEKYNIFPSKDNIFTCRLWASSRILAFKTEELCNQFLKNFRDLIEIAKPLL